MQSMNVNGMQVIVLNQQALPNEQLTSRVMKPRLAKQLVGLGVVQILIGVFCIIFQSISLVNSSSSRFLPSGHGFWSGLTFLVTGIIGITAGIRKSNCQVVAFSILSIISAVLTLALISLAAVSVDFVVTSSYESAASYHERLIKLIMESMLVAMGTLEGIIAIWSSIVCCVIGVCCCRRASPPQQPMILSAEQQAALMSNPMFLQSQQQSTVGFYPQQQTVQCNRKLPNAPPHAHNNFMSATTVEGSYTGLNTGMIRNLPSADMHASAYITTSGYEEIHDYLDVVE